MNSYVRDGINIRLIDETSDELPLVTVDMISYNHEDFIAGAIEGVMKQVTDFKYVLLIGEDCSTDSTRAILIEFQKKYPERIILKLPEKNLGMISNTFSNLDLCKSKYVAWCEGDDLWTDPFKLQKQVDFLQANPGYSLVAGGYIAKNTFSKEEQKVVFDMGTGEGFEITTELFFKEWLTKTLTLMFRIDALDINDLKKYSLCNDIHFNYHLLQRGKGYYMPEIFGVYHIHEGGVFSSLDKAKKRLVSYFVFKELAKYNDNKWIRINYLNSLRFLVKNRIAQDKGSKLFFRMKLVVELFSGIKTRKEFKKAVKSFLKL